MQARNKPTGCPAGWWDDARGDWDFRSDGVREYLDEVALATPWPDLPKDAWHKKRLALEAECARRRKERKLADVEESDRQTLTYQRIMKAARDSFVAAKPLSMGGMEAYCLRVADVSYQYHLACRTDPTIRNPGWKDPDRWQQGDPLDDMIAASGLGEYMEATETAKGANEALAAACAGLIEDMKAWKGWSQPAGLAGKGG